MKNLSLFSLLFMAGLLLFVSSCQRDELFEASYQIKFKPKDYNPVFDTLANLSSFTGSSIGILAPSLIQLKQMNSILKEISPNLELARRIKQSVSAGIMPDFDFSILARSNENDNFYTIAVPFVRDSSVHFILLFHKKEDQYSFKMYSKNEYLNLIDINRDYPEEEINYIFKIIGFAITYQTQIEKVYENKLTQWVEKYKDFNIRSLDDSRCYEIHTTIWYQYATLNYEPQYNGVATMNIHLGWVEITEFYSCPEIFGPFTEPPHIEGYGGGPSGSGSGVSGVENSQAIKMFLPGLPDDCIKSMNNETRELLANIISLEKEGCNNDQRLKDLELEIMNGCNRNQFAAETASNDPFGFEQALNSWDFEQEIRNTLDGYLGINNTLDQNVTPFSANQKMCNKILDVVPSVNNPDRDQAIGLQNLSISLNNNINFSFNYLTFNITKPTHCNLTVDDIFTQAFNSAVIEANTKIDENKPIFPGSFTSESTEFLALLTSEIKRIGIENQCTESAADFTVNPILTNSPSRAFDCATKFVNLSGLNIQELCP